MEALMQIKFQTYCHKAFASVIQVFQTSLTRNVHCKIIFEFKLPPSSEISRLLSITVLLTSCLSCLDSAALLVLNQTHACMVKSKPVRKERYVPLQSECYQPSLSNRNYERARIDSFYTLFCLGAKNRFFKQELLSYSYRILTIGNKF